MCLANNCDRADYGFTQYCKRHYQQILKFGKLLDRTKYDPNEIIVDGSFCRMKLYDIDCNEIAETIFEYQFINYFSPYKWHLNNCGYVKCSYLDENMNRRSMLMHRAIMFIKNNFELHDFIDIDHKDENPLHNVSSNLRICNASQNGMNRGKQTGIYSSEYVGVCWQKYYQKWVSYIVIYGKQINLGYFDDETDAAIAYNVAAVQYHKEFARLNVVPEQIDFKVAVNM